jgi:hypothetical protein
MAHRRASTERGALPGTPFFVSGRRWLRRPDPRWKWAEHEVLVAADPADTARWADMRYGEKCEHVAAALAELRRAYAAASGE